MRKRVVLLALLILLIFGVTQVATAEEAWHPNKGPRELNVEDWISLADTLKLTDEQAAKIQKLQKNHFEKTKALKAELQGNMFALGQLRWQKNVDQKTVVEKIDKVNELRGKLFEEHQKYHQELEQILTPDQRTQLKSLCKPKGKNHRYNRATSTGDCSVFATV